jgi:hypothetical protein
MSEIELLKEKINLFLSEKLRKRYGAIDGPNFRALSEAAPFVFLNLCEPVSCPLPVFPSAFLAD